MDDTEDDARYPLNPYPQTNRRPFPCSNYSSYTNNYTNNQDLSFNDARGQEEEEEAAADEEEEEDENENENEFNNDSSESRGKRRRLDRYARGFELVPRSLPSSSSSPASKHLQMSWSEDSTFALLNAWGDRYLQNGRKSLRSDEWGEVANKVSQGLLKTKIRSEAQCRNRLDTLKKKYKKEKAYYCSSSRSSSSSSKWIYFQKMDELMLLSPAPPIPHPQPLRLSCGIDAGEYVFGSSRRFSNHSDSPGDTASEGGEHEEAADDESDGLPPITEKLGGTSESSFKMLADSINKFGAIYEKIESSKRQQMAELARMRKDFHRDLEVQKKQILDRAQAEIARLSQEDEEEDEEERTDEDGDVDEDDDIDVSLENISG